MVAWMPIRLTAAPTSSPLLQTAVPFPENSLIKLKSKAVWVLIYCVSEREREKENSDLLRYFSGEYGKKRLSEFSKEQRKKKKPTATCYANKGQAAACGAEKVAPVLLRSDVAVSAQGSAQSQQAALWCATHTKKEKSPCTESTHGQTWRAGRDQGTVLDVCVLCCPQADTS